MNDAFTLTKNEWRMRLVHECRTRRIPILFPIRRSSYYISDSPDLLVSIGGGKYIGLVYLPESEDKDIENSRYRRRQRIDRIRKQQSLITVHSLDEAVEKIIELHKKGKP